jgi:hypothetical protein
MPADFQLKLDHQFAFKTAPIPAANFDGSIICRVLEIEPERKLKISWGEGSLDWRTGVFPSLARILAKQIAQEA